MRKLTNDEVLNVALKTSVTIIYKSDEQLAFNDRVKHFWLEGDLGNSMTLYNVLEILENEYKYGVITVLSEDELSGEVYKFNNYNDNCWYECGRLEGFA